MQPRPGFTPTPPGPRPGGPGVPPNQQPPYTGMRPSGPVNPNIANKRPSDARPPNNLKK
jgi:hypothetical protein